MSHSVERHLDVTPRAYDVEIRRFVPGYDAMLDEVARVIVGLRSIDAPLEILDLGAGTGGLSAHLAAHLPRARLTLLDADAAMLSRAQERLAQHRGRVRTQHGSFLDALPRCDVAVASLALHHVHDAKTKRALYANVRRTLAPGGFLVTADAMVSNVAALSTITRARWAAHLVANGDTEAQAYARFDDWANEDRYFSVEEEIDMMRVADFHGVEVVWRAGPCAVLLALAP